jgi:glyoxylase-like metal-dependent hydrolase (beta-lactamase superfamily II)
MARVHSLYEGSFSVDASKKFIPFDPTIHDKKDRPASLFIHVHPFIIETDSGLLLLDTGLGFVDEEGELLLHQRLRQKGFDSEDVRYVLLSHLHKDHASGMVTQVDGRY